MNAPRTAWLFSAMLALLQAGCAFFPQQTEKHTDLILSGHVDKHTREFLTQHGLLLTVFFDESDDRVIEIPVQSNGKFTTALPQKDFQRILYVGERHRPYLRAYPTLDENGNAYATLSAADEASVAALQLLTTDTSSEVGISQEKREDFDKRYSSLRRHMRKLSDDNLSASALLFLAFFQSDLDPQLAKLLCVDPSSDTTTTKTRVTKQKEKLLLAPPELLLRYHNDELDGDAYLIKLSAYLAAYPRLGEATLRSLRDDPVFLDTGLANLSCDQSADYSAELRNRLCPPTRPEAEETNSTTKPDAQNESSVDASQSTTQPTDEDNNTGATNSDTSGDDLPPSSVISLLSEPQLIAQVGLPYAYYINATSSNNKTIAVDIIEGPAFLSLSGLQISGTPVASDIGNHTLFIVLSTASGDILGKRVTISVVPVNGPPVITSLCLNAAFVDFVYNCQAKASDDDGDKLTYSLSKMPDGMVIDHQKGRILWTPLPEQANQSFEVILRVSDGTQTDEQRFFISTLASGGEGRTVDHLGGETLDINASSEWADGIATSILYPIPADPTLTSFGFTVVGAGPEGQDAKDLDLYSAKTPSGQVLIGPNPTNIPPIGKTNSRLEGQSALSFVFPNTRDLFAPFLPFANGNYTVQFQSFSDVPTTIEVYAVRKFDADPTQGVLALNFFVVGSYLAETTYPSLQITSSTGLNMTIADRIAAIYKPIGITVAVASITTLADDNGTLSIDGSQYNAQLVQAMADLLHKSASGESNDVSANAVSVFFVEGIVDISQPNLDTVLGYTPDIPGALIAGTSASGLFVSVYDKLSTLNNADLNAVSFTTAHELGHYLGLYHPTETNFVDHDSLGDTLECTLDDDDGNFSFERNDCTSKGADNLMFPVPANDYGNKALSQEQAYVLNRNPWVQ